MVEISEKVEDFLRHSEDKTVTALMDPDKKLWNDVLGITYKTSDGQVYRNMDAKPIADLDSLPWPAYNLFRMDKYTNLQPGHGPRQRRAQL